ncbi:hypothetical protein E2C01_049839 [Portunus trituberculatus]|uniref:Uncharacterized protein n=1 Tax=Portunus trituberculatus TaxID=210409 RepID=A0A5B7GH69_PORTR|nr:hypothetical protein [Portunus trituberculatus]
MQLRPTLHRFRRKLTRVTYSLDEMSLICLALEESNPVVSSVVSPASHTIRLSLADAWLSLCTSTSH